MKNSNDIIGNRTRNLLACSAVPQPTAPPRTPCNTTRHHFSSDNNFYNHRCQNFWFRVIMPARLPSIGLHTYNVVTQLNFITFTLEETLRAQRVEEVQLHSFFNLDGGGLSMQRPGRPLVQRLRFPLYRGWSKGGTLLEALLQVWSSSVVQGAAAGYF